MADAGSASRSSDDGLLNSDVANTTKPEMMSSTARQMATVMQPQPFLPAPLAGCPAEGGGVMGWPD